MSISKLALLLAVIAVACLGAATAHATSLRTWVSNAGSDSNPCSVTQPCLTFQGAINNTTSGGEINCLTPGSFGGSNGVTINISVTINCRGVSNGGIQVPYGVNAITINTANIIVNLVGLDINGTSSGGSTGVAIFAAATVNIRNCKIYASNDAIDLTAGNLTVDNVFVAYNAQGIVAENLSGVINMTVRNANINNNGHGIVVYNGGTHAGATIEQSTLSFNGTGLSIVNPGAVALIGGSTVVNNGTGVGTGSGGILYSFEDNQIGGNGTDGTPLTAYPGGPLN